MERDLTAMRDVLLHVEQHMPFTGNLRQLLPAEVESDRDEKEVSYAIYLLLDCGYLDGVWSPQPHQPSPPQIRAITNEGHEFLELTRDPEIWTSISKALEEMDDASWSLDVLRAAAKRLSEEKLVAAVESSGEET